MGSTTRGFRYPELTDAPPDIKVAVKNLADDVNAKGSKFVYGPEGSLPAWAATYEGTTYTATDTGNQFFGTNTAWISVRNSRTLAHILFPADITVNTQTEASPVTLIDFGAITFNGSAKIKIEAFFPWIDPHTGGGGSPPGAVFSLWDGITNLGKIGYFFPTQNSVSIPLKLEVQEITPSSGSHQYKIRAWNDNIPAGGYYIVKGGAAFPAGSGNFNRGFGRIVSV